jgi:DNA helicase-2/ATP-dependent DNA helicase PcrA
MYGFNPPIHEALGYGKGLHDALAEMHKKALCGEILRREAAGDLVRRHLHTPYAYPALREQLQVAAVAALERYFDVHGEDLTRTIHSEKQIQVHIAPGSTWSSGSRRMRSPSWTSSPRIAPRRRT